MAVHTMDPGSIAAIIDIRRGEVTETLLKDIREHLRPENGGEKQLPTMLLYDERGLKIFEEITYLDEYYLTGAEIEVLERYASAIAERIPTGSQIVELGSGNLRKVNILLEAIDTAEKEIDYYALDLSRAELERTLAAVRPGTYKYVRCHGLHGTYDDGLVWLQSKQNRHKPKCIMTMGSSIGNFPRPDAAAFLKEFANTLSPKDIILVGVDGCQDAERVYHAYNDRYGITHQFTLNGLKHANSILGKHAFDLNVWHAIGEYDEETGKHQAFVSPDKDVEIEGVRIHAGERVRIEESYKYSPAQRERLWQHAGLTVGAVFSDSTGTYHINMLFKPDFNFSNDPREYAATAVPRLDDWQQLWISWDLVTRKMLPEQGLLSQPIKLRNCCLFYLGHIPTFLDIHLTRATDGKPTPPDNYPGIFERGIDPDVDNPELCHAHSEVPDEWPPASEVLQFQHDVRERVRKIYDNDDVNKIPRLRRVLSLTFEHEAMHLETFLYMLLQSNQVVPPPGPKPDFQALADEAAVNAVPNEWLQVPTSRITVGRNDTEDNYNVGHFFGWDNESPARTVDVHPFETRSHPITNGDYARYLVAKGIRVIPVSWVRSMLPNSGHHPHNGTNGHTSEADVMSFIQGMAVRTVYGCVPLRLALDWPLSTSYDELAACATYNGGRIPTLEEARSIYNYTEQQRLKDFGHVSPETIPAVNGHLSNNGVHQTPPSQPVLLQPDSDAMSEQAAERERKELFADLTGANVGFKHFHPMPVTGVSHGQKQLAGLAGIGGLWEWTSTPLAKHEGFKAMDLYPGYTADFFDNKHNIVLGGSWATHPRIAGRKTFVNWYQRNYPYAWAGARVVRDL